MSAATIFLAVLLMVDAVGCVPAPSAPATAGTPMFGLTFSQRQADYLKLPWRQVYGATLDLAPELLGGEDALRRSIGHVTHADFDGRRRLDVAVPVSPSAPARCRDDLVRTGVEAQRLDHGAPDAAGPPTSVCQPGESAAQQPPEAESAQPQRGRED